MAGAPPVYKPTLSPAAKELMKTRGWDKGFVVFGAPLSEATAKLVTAASLLTARAQDFGFPEKEYRLVEMDFNDKDTWTADGKGTLGVWSPAWRELSNSGPMPGMALNGELFLDTKEILKGLVADYVDQSLSAQEQQQVKWWVDFNGQWQDKLMVVVSHWGWAGFHGRVNDMPADRYEKAFGQVGRGKKDPKWEKERIIELDAFFSEMEAKLSGTLIPGTGFLVANKTSLADCAMVNWYHTFYDIAALDLGKRYPSVTKFYKKQDELNIPDGAKDHQTKFPMFGKFVHLINICGGDRGCMGSHDINNPALWPAEQQQK